MNERPLRNGEEKKKQKAAESGIPTSWRWPLSEFTHMDDGQREYIIIIL